MTHLAECRIGLTRPSGIGLGKSCSKWDIDLVQFFAQGCQRDLVQPQRCRNSDEIVIYI
jgi:hypothetical protein